MEKDNPEPGSPRSKELHATRREELCKRQISNTENLDKSILTYSAGGLAISLGFLKDFVLVNRAEIVWSLLWSWRLFTLAIILVILSYVLSLYVLDFQLVEAKRYYEGDGKKLKT